MDSNSVLERIFSDYAKLPEKNKHKDFHGSASKLMSKHGDFLRPLADDLGEELYESFQAFLADSYWQQYGYPIYAFKKQHNKYLSSKSSAIQTAAKTATPSRHVPKPKTWLMPNSGAKVEPTNDPTMAVFRAETGCHAVRRKGEALCLLRQVNAALAASCVEEIGKRLEPGMYGRVEYWHTVAVDEFKKKFGQDPVIITEPCTMEES